MTVKTVQVLYQQELRGHLSLYNQLFVSYKISDK